MRTLRITYWITTGLVCLMMAFSGVAYFVNPDMKLAFAHLGFPDYFRIELAIAKFIGVLLLVSPVPAWLKEWAYAGFTVVMISAFIAHTAAGDPFMARTMPVIFLVLLIVSYVSYRVLWFMPVKKPQEREEYPYTF